VQTKIYLAVGISIVLIGGAFFIRLNEEREREASLAIVEGRPNLDSAYEKFAEEYLNATTTSFSTSTPQKLTGTDLISRQLFSDYITLAAQGQATDSSVNALLEKYIDSIPTLSSSVSFVYSDFTPVSNSKTEMSAYNKTMTELYKDYRDGILSVSSNGNDLFSGNIDAKLASLLSQVYRRTAEEMREVPVPSALMSLHMNLANLYLENSAAMKAISESDIDSASAFSGLIALSENTTQEKELITQINTTLKANGI
jgi:prophage DNA circulation protein